MASLLFKNCALLDPLVPNLLTQRDVLVVDERIAKVSETPITTEVDQVIDVQGKTLMPGLIDCHVHVMATQLNLSTQGVLPDALVMMRAVPIMEAMLRRGFTTVRDAGGAGWGLKCAIEEGTIDGPRLFTAGRALSQTGGHGDPRPRSDHLQPVSYTHLTLPTIYSV